MIVTALSDQAKQHQARGRQTQQWSGLRRRSLELSDRLPESCRETKRWHDVSDDEGSGQAEKLRVRATDRFQPGAAGEL